MRGITMVNMLLWRNDLSITVNEDTQMVEVVVTNRETGNSHMTTAYTAREACKKGLDDTKKVATDTAYNF